MAEIVRAGSLLTGGRYERERLSRPFGETTDASAVDDQHGSAGLVGFTIADARHDRVRTRSLTRCRFANFVSELGEVGIGCFEDVTTFEFGAHRNLKQF